MGVATEAAVTAGAAMAAEAKVAVVSWSRQLEPSAGAVAVRTELRDAVAEPVPLRRDVAGAGKLERSTGRGHIRAASAETARWQWPRRGGSRIHRRYDLRLARTHRRGRPGPRRCSRCRLARAHLCLGSMAAIACSTCCGSPALGTKAFCSPTFFEWHFQIPNLGKHALFNNS